MATISMRIKYDGSNYHGWQRQSVHPSVQEVVERALSKALIQTINIDASGRTDAGVHAIGQSISFKAILNMPIENLKFVINRILPSDILVSDVALENDDFHARYCAVGKTYMYKIYTTQERDPFLDKYSYHFAQNLDLLAIREAMNCFLGTHDFKTFMASGSNAKNTIRSIYSFELQENDCELIFTITGDGFLYNMVRIIIGTLLHVGVHKIESSQVESIIFSGERNRAKYTAPANGLYLKNVYYSDEILKKSFSKTEF